jgi:hypothetical protein
MKEALFALLCLNALLVVPTGAGAQTMPPSDAAAKQDSRSSEAAPADPARTRACTAQAAAKRDPERQAFIKFCLDYEGSAAASVFAWNKKTRKM